MLTVGGPLYPGLYSRRGRKRWKRSGPGFLIKQTAMKGNVDISGWDPEKIEFFHWHILTKKKRKQRGLPEHQYEYAESREGVSEKRLRRWKSEPDFKELFRQVGTDQFQPDLMEIVENLVTVAKETSNPNHIKLALDTFGIGYKYLDDGKEETEEKSNEDKSREEHMADIDEILDKMNDIKKD